jgi:translocation and assembly module TamB
VDRLRLGLGEGSVEVAGRLVPALDLDARLSQLPLEAVALVLPDLPLTGTLAGEARLTGPIEALAGSVRLQAEGLRPTRGAGRGLPPAEIQVAASLGPAATRIDASARAGTDSRLGLRGTLGGTLPFKSGALDLRADGGIDLALLDPLLTAAGRQVTGRAVLDARVTGTLTAPRLAGSLRLTNGALWDRTIGLVLTQVQGGLALVGDALRLEGLSARAGPGTLALAGSLGILAPGIPVDLRLTAEDASPLQLDRLDVQGNADLRLTGQALGRLDAAGTLRLKRVEIRLPERLPPEVVTLEVREVGQRRSGDSRTATRPPWQPDLGLDLRLAAPRAVYVQGRGVDAELGGEVRLRGTLAEPFLSGGFDLVRGDYELAGQTLRFSRGRLGFDGAAGLNPSLDLEARVTAAGSTAILAVQGTAQTPRIELRGEPAMPQDEVLSRLLFGVAGGRLSPWQATRVGLAAASLAGIEVGDFKLLERLRGGLGLSRLGVGTDERGDTSVEGGRQVSERVYLGARQGTRAGEPQGVLRIEVSPRIRVEADVGPIGGTRAGAAFEHEY